MANKNQWLKGVGMGLMGFAKTANEKRRIDIEAQKADTLARVQEGGLSLRREELGVSREQLEINRQDLLAKQNAATRGMNITENQYGAANELTASGQGIQRELGLMRDTTANRGIGVQEALGQERNRLTGIGQNLSADVAREGISMREAIGVTQGENAAEANRIREEVGTGQIAATLSGQESRERIADASLTAQENQWGTLNKAALGDDQDKFVAGVQERIDNLLEPGDREQVQFLKQVDAILKGVGGLDGLSPQEAQESITELEDIYRDKKMASLNLDSTMKKDPAVKAAKREVNAYMDEVTGLLKSARSRGALRFGPEFGESLSGYLSLGEDSSFLQDPLEPYSPTGRRADTPTQQYPNRGSDAFMPTDDGGGLFDWFKDTRVEGGTRADQADRGPNQPQIETGLMGVVPAVQKYWNEGNVDGT